LEKLCGKPNGYFAEGRHDASEAVVGADLKPCTIAGNINARHRHRVMFVGSGINDRQRRSSMTGLRRRRRSCIAEGWRLGMLPNYKALRRISMPGPARLVFGSLCFITRSS
jgi:hypothetical protein